MDYIKEFIPNENEYDFQFSKDECEKVRLGKCPVLEEIDNILNGNVKDFKCKCVSLIYNIIHNGFIERNTASWIIVEKEKDGHYTVTNGRHRICAASKMQIPIKLHIYEDDETE